MTVMARAWRVRSRSCRALRNAAATRLAARLRYRLTLPVLIGSRRVLTSFSSVPASFRLHQVASTVLAQNRRRLRIAPSRADHLPVGQAGCWRGTGRPTINFQGSAALKPAPCNVRPRGGQELSGKHLSRAAKCCCSTEKPRAHQSSCSTGRARPGSLQSPKILTK